MTHSTFILFALVAFLAASTADLTGRVELATTQFIRGWACDPSLPNAVTIEALENGVVLETTTTTISRPDIAAQCGNNPVRGFEITFSQNTLALLSAGIHTVFVRATISDGLVESLTLPGSPVRIAFQPTQSFPPFQSFPPTGNPSIGGTTPLGTLESVNGRIVGWACDPLRPFAPVSVSITIDGNFVGNAFANIGREQSIGSMCGGNRFHGFSFQIPNFIFFRLTRGVHIVVVTIVGGGTLSGSPQQLFIS